MNLVDLLGVAGFRWFAWMGAMSLQVALLTGIVLGVSAVLRRAPASLRFGLWALIFVKLVLHPALATPWSPGNLALELPVKLEMRSAQTLPKIEKPPSAAIVESPENIEKVAIPKSQNTSPKGGAALVSLIGLMAVWAVVAAALLLLVFGQAFLFSRQLMRQLTPAPENMVQVLHQQQERLNTGRGSLWLCKSITTPGVFGIWRPRILLPFAWSESPDEHELACVLAHELAHVKRWDLLIGWLTTILTCVYWFHPAVWLANLKMRREREMACDDAALLATGREGREYAGTILRVAQGFTERVPAGVGMLGLLEIYDNLLQRIRSVGDANRARAATWRSSIVLIALLCFLPMGTWHGFAAPEPLPQAPGNHPEVVAETPPSIPAPVNSTPGLPAAPVEADQEIPGVAFLEIAVMGGGAANADTANALYELLTERLLNAGNVKLVERNALKQATQELNLDSSGLVRADTAAQIGKLLSARTLISAKLMEIAPDWILTARLIDSQTGELAAIRIESPVSEGISKFAEVAGQRIAEKLAVFGVSEKSAPDPQQAAMLALRQSLTGKVLPRVVVCIPESHVGSWTPDPAGENAICSVLAQAGFPVVDVSTFMKRPTSNWWMNIFHGASQERDGTDIGIQQGFRSVSDILHDARLDKVKENADIFIVGEAFSELAAEQYGFKSCRARIELKALDTKTEQVAASLSQHATAADTAELIAGKAALRNAGGLLGIDLATQLSSYWDNVQRIGKTAS